MDGVPNDMPSVAETSGDSGSVPIQSQDKDKPQEVPGMKTNMTSYSFVRNTQQEEQNQSNHSPPPNNDQNSTQKVPQQFMASMGYQQPGMLSQGYMMDGIAKPDGLQQMVSNIPPGHASYNQMQAPPMMMQNFPQQKQPQMMMNVPADLQSKYKFIF